jgi:hypothetical protein
VDRKPRRRSRKPLMWGGVLVVVGVVIGVVLIITAFTRLDDKVSSFYRLGAPDVQEVFFDSAGEYVIYDESLGLPQDGVAPFEVTVTRTGTGLDVPVSASVDDIDYDTSGNSGQAVFEFSIPAVGTYEIQTSVSVDAGLAQLAIGRSVFGDLLKGLVLAAVVGGGIIVLGILIAVIGSIPRRQRGRSGSARTSGSRETSDRERPAEHGRSPLSRRSDAHREEDALHPRPHQESAPPPPSPPTDPLPSPSPSSVPPPPPPSRAVKRRQHRLAERVPAPPRELAPPELTEPELTDPEPAPSRSGAHTPNNSLSVAGLDFESETLSSLEPVAIVPEVMGLETYDLASGVLADPASIVIVGLEVSDLDVIGLDSADDEGASLRL